MARHVTAQTPFRLLGRDEDDDRHAVTSRDSRDVVNPVAGPDNIIETANAAAAAAADAAAEAVGGDLRPSHRAWQSMLHGTQQQTLLTESKKPVVKTCVASTRL